MTSIIAANITSPLGFDAESNFSALREGRSALQKVTGWKGIPGTVTAGAFSGEQNARLAVSGFSRFESLVLHSVSEALEHCVIDVKSQRTVLIISTTKADIEELECGGGYKGPREAACRVAGRLGFVTEPIVVCNACISGVTATVLADRLINAGIYDTAVVCGADCLSRFTVAGFLSFKALSEEPCRPFDIERLGLNLGEAAATVVMTGCSVADSGTEAVWRLAGCALDNDAYNISAPVPSGEGVERAIRQALGDFPVGKLAAVGVHGTATMFNDQMESRAIESAGLSQVPLSALKGYYGHTLGASGILETIIMMMSVDAGIVLPSLGYSERGVSGAVTISSGSITTEKRAFLKVISGFGGCNGALLLSKDGYAGGANCRGNDCEESEAGPVVRATVRITPSSVTLDGKDLHPEGSGKGILDWIYRTYIGNWPRFHKMDTLSKVAFAAAELLAGETGTTAPERKGIVLFNECSSIVSDRQHIATINDTAGFFPSPATFLYTLPNIATGEIAIRQGCKGESTLIIPGRKDDAEMNAIASCTLRSLAGTLITGWVDCRSDDDFEADMKIMTI